jgi:hypothetical protein
VFAGLRPHGSKEDVFLLCGGHDAVRTECCYWEKKHPEAAQPLAHWYHDNYGKIDTLQHSCLIECQFGKGRILAYGAGPLEIRANPHRKNLEQFLMNCLNYLAPTDLKNPLRIGMLPNFNAQLGVDTYSSLVGLHRLTISVVDANQPHLLTSENALSTSLRCAAPTLSSSLPRTWAIEPFPRIRARDFPSPGRRVTQYHDRRITGEVLSTPFGHAKKS